MPGHATLVGHVFILLAQVLTLAYQWFDAERRHRWQREQFQQLHTAIQNGHGEAPPARPGGAPPGPEA